MNLWRFTSSPSWLWHNLCNPYSSTVYYLLSGECVTSPVLTCHSKNLKWQMDRCYSSVLQLSFIWQAKENTSRGVRADQPKRREEKPTPPLNLALFFFFSHAALFFPPFIFISWRLITLQYYSGFCHTLTRISYVYAKQKKRHRCIEQTFGLCGRRRGGDVSREQHRNMYII